MSNILRVGLVGCPTHLLRCPSLAIPSSGSAPCTVGDILTGLLFLRASQWREGSSALSLALC